MGKMFIIRSENGQPKESTERQKIRGSSDIAMLSLSEFEK